MWRLTVRASLLLDAVAKLHKNLLSEVAIQ